jgi:hypothetical protein
MRTASLSVVKDFYRDINELVNSEAAKNSSGRPRCRLQPKKGTIIAAMSTFSLPRAHLRAIYVPNEADLYGASHASD